MDFNEAWECVASRAILQDRDELRFLFQLVRGAGCTSVLEIGSKCGGSLFILAQALLPGSRVVSIDKHVNPKDAMQLTRVIERLNGQGFDAVDIAGNSHDEAVFAQVKDEEFDLVFIDGDHNLEGARQDLAWYGARADKLVAFHDVHNEGAKFRKLPSVYDLWREPELGSRVRCDIRGPYGIGVIGVK